jgi:outer membrane biosynthesis protein TonB
MKDDNTRFYDEYQKMLQEKFSELRTYKSISYMLNNNELLDMQRNVDQLRDTFWEKCYQFSDMFTRYFGLDQTDEISEATEHLNITVNAIADLEKQMVDLQNTMKAKLDGIIADRKKAYEEEQAQEAAEASRRAAEEEAQRKAEAGDEPEEPEVTEEKQPEKMTPNKFGKAKPAPKSEPEPKEEPKVAKKVPTEPQPTLKPADGIVPVSGASGTITKSYEEVPQYKVPGIGILKPSEGAPLETSGKIIVQ